MRGPIHRIRMLRGSRSGLCLREETRTGRAETGRRGSQLEIFPVSLILPVVQDPSADQQYQQMQREEEPHRRVCRGREGVSVRRVAFPVNDTYISCLGIEARIIAWKKIEMSRHTAEVSIRRLRHQSVCKLRISGSRRSRDDSARRRERENILSRHLF